MAMWTQVIGIADNASMDARTLNSPLAQLRSRTDYLYNRLQDLAGDGRFESLRLTDAELDTDNVPAVRDIVYLDPEMRVYRRAMVSIALESNVFQIARDTAYAVGILVSKAGSRGTILVQGKLGLADTSPWELNTLLEGDEAFRPGPYYLSASEPGKLTAYPQGAAVYIGYFTDDAATPGKGGTAIISPQYKDVGEAHLHRALPLVGQPAGIQLVEGDAPDAVHSLAGFEPRSVHRTAHGSHTGDDASDTLRDGLYNFTLANYIGLPITNITADPPAASVVTNNDTTEVTTADAITWDRGAEWYIGPRVRLVIKGAYTGYDSTEYTLTLTDSTGVAAAGSNAPSNGPHGFADVYLKWVSSDPSEGEGLARVTSYELPVAFGRKGCVAVLENTLEGTGVADEMWNWCEAAIEDLSRRQWRVTVPEDTVGWRTRKFHQAAARATDTTGEFTLVAFGKYTNALGRIYEELTIVCTRLYKLVYSGTPSAGDTVKVGNTVYEFSETGAPASEEHIPVALNRVSVEDTYTSLCDAIIERNDDGIHIAADAERSTLFIGTPVGATTELGAGYHSATLQRVFAGDAGEIVNGTPSLLVYDTDHTAQVADEQGYWNAAEYYHPVELKNGIKLMWVPFNSDGEAVSGSTVAPGDCWSVSLADAAPGALFEYALDMDMMLRKYYPPVPLSAATLVVNGVEMENYATHPAAPVWRPTHNGLYWYPSDYGRVPWPVDWESRSLPGTYATLITFYLAHMRVQNTSTVTSLRPAPGAPVSITRCGTNQPATVGDLMVDVALKLSEEDAGLDDYLVPKRVRGTTLLKGPVVSRVRAGTGIEISSPPGVPEGAGEVTVSLADAQGYSGNFGKLAYRNAKQEMIGAFPYTKLLGWDPDKRNVPSGFVAQFQVPYTVEGAYQVFIYMTVFGERDIPFNEGAPNPVQHVGLTFNYSVLRDYQPYRGAGSETYGTLVDNVIAPARGPARIEIPLGVKGGVEYSDADGSAVTKVYGAYDPLVVHNNPNELDVPGRNLRVIDAPFPRIGDLRGKVVTAAPVSNVAVQAGSMVSVELQRGDVTSGAAPYTGALGIMQLRWRLTRVD